MSENEVVGAGDRAMAEELRAAMVAGLTLDSIGAALDIPVSELHDLLADAQLTSAQVAQVRRLLKGVDLGRGRTETVDDAATEVELVYSDHCSDYDGAVSSVPHRVVKKTAARVYVDRELYRPDRWQDEARKYGVRTFVLDRVALERDGQAWGSRFHTRELYFTRSHEERR